MKIPCPIRNRNRDRSLALALLALAVSMVCCVATPCIEHIQIDTNVIKAYTCSTLTAKQSCILPSEGEKGARPQCNETNGVSLLLFSSQSEGERVLMVQTIGEEAKQDVAGPIGISIR